MPDMDHIAERYLLSEQMALECKMLNEDKEKEHYARVVQVRIEFVSIGEVDTYKEKYQAEIKVKSSWYDNEVLEEYDPDVHWYPKLFVENAIYDKYYEDISFRTSKVDGKTMITETRVCKGYFWEKIELNDFPIDIQELSITIASRLKPSQCTIVADTNKRSTMHPEALKTFKDQQKFRLYRLVDIKDSAPYDLIQPLNKKSKRSKLCATTFASRKPGYYLLNVYQFNLLITVLSFTQFAFEVEQASSRISRTFTLILTSVFFKTTLSRMIPTISYMTSLDQYQIVSIVFLVACCVWHSLISSINIEMSTKKTLDQTFLYFLSVVFVLIQIGFSISFYFSTRKLKTLKVREAKFIANAPTDFSDDEDDD